MKKIKSFSNSKIKYLISLKKASRRRKDGVIIIEGEKEIQQAIKSKIDIISYYFCKEFSVNKEIIENLLKYKGIEVSKEIFKRISYKNKPNGILILAKRPQLALTSLKFSQTPLVLVLESVEKPGNLGAILRTAEAVGVEAVILCDPQTDIYHPNSIRASLGAIFVVPTLTSDNQSVFDYLLNNKINIYSAELAASIDYKQPNYQKSTAIVIGTEHAGLSNFWLINSRANIKIPMLGRLDSLNASVSTAVILYEVLRQRQV